MSNKVNKPHLRNVFFRAAALQALNIHVRFNDWNSGSNFENKK
jgi:hypothetical protein